MITFEQAPETKNLTFFDRAASEWDKRIRKQDHSAIKKLISRAGLSPGDSVLDIGTGTGIMIPYYRNSGVGRITAVDNSVEMCRITASKFSDLEIICASFPEWAPADNSFDKIIIFNTFPHLKKTGDVFTTSSRCLKNGGRLIIAHSMSRCELAECHRRKGHDVENDLIPNDVTLITGFHSAGFTSINIEDSSGFFIAEGILS